MTTLSFDYDPSAKPSVQIRALADIHRPDDPLDMDALEWIIKMPFEAACHDIDSEYCSPSVLRTLALHLRCQAKYLFDIHADHRRNFHHVSDAKVQKIARQRAEESKALAKQTQENRMRESRVKELVIGWGIPDELY